MRPLIECHALRVPVRRRHQREDDRTGRAGGRERGHADQDDHRDRVLRFHLCLLARALYARNSLTTYIAAGWRSNRVAEVGERSLTLAHDRGRACTARTPATAATRGSLVRGRTRDRCIRLSTPSTGRTPQLFGSSVCAAA